MNSLVRAVLFDLDGTLLDTAPDLANALNYVLIQHGRKPLSEKTIREVVSHGGRALIELGFSLTDKDPELEPLRQQLLAYYKDNLCVDTRLFNGMDCVLDTLESHNIPWGIVTNKPGWLTNPLVKTLKLHQRTNCIVSGDTLKQCKPHPAPLLHAADLIQMKPEHCVYVGDAQRDIEAGKNAGMKTITALFGYLSVSDKPETWSADAMINQPQEILSWLNLGEGHSTIK
ncbi:MAG: HAD-IA family hydrolase [Gammaproteobacteria bacterium]